MRPARPDEAAELAALAVSSKGHRPLPPGALAHFARTHGLTAEVIAANEVRVGELDGAAVGFVTLLHRGSVTVLDDLWLRPDVFGRGLGRQLFADAVEHAVAAGATALEWEAEPDAEGFYQRMGGVTTGYEASRHGPPRPLMRLAIGAGRAV